MAGDLFVNLVVQDLEKAKAFYDGLGYTFNPAFSNESAASFVINEGQHLHLLTHEMMQRFTKRAIAEEPSVWGTIALGADSKEHVDEMAEKALALGAVEEIPAQDHGWMYGRTLRDLDGHIIEWFWADPTQMP